MESLQRKQDGFLTKLTLFKGEGIAHEEIMLNHSLICGEVLFCNIDYSKQISLHPYALYEKCPQCGKPDLFLYGSNKGTNTSYYSFHGGHTMDKELATHFIVDAEQDAAGDGLPPAAEL